MRKRRRKKLPVAEREPLTRPEQPNEVWSMDFVFDELACGRKMKTLTVVDDCSKEAVQIAADSSIPARYVTRLLDEAIAKRGKPGSIRSDNGPEFAGRVMQAWAAERTIEHRFIQPGKPTQNSYIESFNSRFRDECLSQHGFGSLSHMRSVIDTWREDYNERRPHSSCRYLPSALRTQSTTNHVQIRFNHWTLIPHTADLGGSALALLPALQLRLVQVLQDTAHMLSARSRCSRLR